MDGTGATSNRSDTPTWLPFAAAGALVVLVIAVTVLLNSGGTHDTFDLRTSATIPSGHAAAAVVHVGDTVRGSGEVFAPPGGPMRFCDPFAISTGPEPSCASSLALTGAATSRLIPGHAATITGVYHGESLSVTSVSKYVPPRHVQFHDDVPCTAPDSGWPNGTVDISAVYRYRRAHPNDVLLTTVLHPTRTAQVAYVVTAGDPTPAGTALTKTYGKRLCVVQSPFSAEQITTAEQALRQDMRSRPVDLAEAGAAEIDSHGNVFIGASAAIVTPPLAKVIDAQPARLVQLRVWLRPTS